MDRRTYNISRIRNMNENFITKSYKNQQQQIRSHNINQSKLPISNPVLNKINKLQHLNPAYQKICKSKNKNGSSFSKINLNLVQSQSNLILENQFNTPRISSQRKINSLMSSKDNNETKYYCSNCQKYEQLLNIHAIKNTNINKSSLQNKTRKKKKNNYSDIKIRERLKWSMMEEYIRKQIENYQTQIQKVSIQIMQKCKQVIIEMQQKIFRLECNQIHNEEDISNLKNQLQKSLASHNQKTLNNDSNKNKLKRSRNKQKGAEWRNSNQLTIIDQEITEDCEKQ